MKPSRLLLLAFVPVSLLSAATALATDITGIEEDWQLVISKPDRINVSPQVTCTFSPVGDLNSFYAVFDVNLRNFPSYEAGGMQLQLWNGSNSVEAIRDKAGYTLQSDDETVTWTQRMAISGGTLQFTVLNGASDTWGEFGSATTFKITVPTELENLNGYRRELSVENSGIGYGANRVVSLTLVGVRCYADGVLVAADDTPSVVFPHD